MPQFYCPQLQIGTVVLDAAETRHARASRRLDSGDPVRVFDGNGTVADAVIIGHSSAAGLSARVTSIEKVPAPNPALTLIVAVPKGDRLEWMIEKCTELGVSRFCLTHFERSVVSPRDSKLNKLQRIALEACKQSDRAWIPAIDTAGDLAAALSARASAALLIADRAADAVALGEWLMRNDASTGEIAVVIGPEGGLAPEESRTTQASARAVVRLGDGVLRIETAAVAAAAVVAARA